MYQRLSGRQTRAVANAKEYLTNRVRLHLGAGWRVDLHELALELVVSSLGKFLSNDFKKFGRHFERFEE